MAICDEPLLLTALEQFAVVLDELEHGARHRIQHGRGDRDVDVFFDLVENISPGPYLEMFARSPRPGWAVWGNEVTNTVEIPTKNIGEK